MKATVGFSFSWCFTSGFSGQAGGWFVVSIFQQASMLLKLFMSHPGPLVLLGLPLFERFGPSKMHLANAPAILNILDGPVGVDPAFLYCLVQVSYDA